MNKSTSIITSVLTVVLVAISSILWVKVAALEKAKGASTFSSVTIHSLKNPNVTIVLDSAGIRIANKEANNESLIGPRGIMVKHSAENGSDPQMSMFGIGVDDKPIAFLGNGIGFNTKGDPSCFGKECNTILLSADVPGISILRRGDLRVSIGVTELTNTATGSRETTAPSSIVLFDKKGKVVSQLPNIFSR